MMKRMGIGILVFAFVLTMGAFAQAAPKLGVGGELIPCTGEYWTCFAGNSASGSGESFSLPASGGTIAVWSGYEGVDIWLLAEPSIGTFSFDVLGPSTTVYVGGGDGKLSSYDTYGTTPPSYQGINLGPTSGGAWSSFPSGSPFNSSFKYYEGVLTYSGTDVAGDWLFVLADRGDTYNGTTILFDDSNSGGGGERHDAVSPKTTSMVPEPGTLLLLGSGLVGLGFYRRKIKA